jgi:hypothetical protein
MIKNKAVDYYRENFGQIIRITSDHEKSTFWLKVHNPEYKYPANGTMYKKLSEGVEQIVYRLDFDFEHYGITLPIKQIKAVKCVEVIDEKYRNFEVTYTITDVKDEELYFRNWESISVYRAIKADDCGKKLAEFIENMFLKDAFVMRYNDRAKRFTIAMPKDFQSITDYFVVTNVNPYPEFELFFRCIKTYSSNINPEVIERTYILKAMRPKPSTIKCGKQTIKFVGKIVEEEDFDESNSCASDPVNHPNHYEMVGSFESFDIIVESLGIEGARYFCQGNVIKYQTRYREKNGEEDLKKRHWYSRMDQMLAKCKTIEDYYKLKESDF